MAGELPVEPPRGSALIDAYGHVFVRRPDGWWVCRDHDNGEVRFGWEEVVLDSVEPWRIEEPGIGR